MITFFYMFSCPTFPHEKVIDTKAPRKCDSSTLSPKNLRKNNRAFNLLIYYFAQCDIKVTNRKNIRLRTTDIGSSKTGTPQLLSYEGRATEVAWHIAAPMDHLFLVLQPYDNHFLPFPHTNICTTYLTLLDCWRRPTKHFISAFEGTFCSECTL